MVSPSSRSTIPRPANSSRQTDDTAVDSFSVSLAVGSRASTTRNNTTGRASRGRYLKPSRYGCGCSRYVTRWNTFSLRTFGSLRGASSSLRSWSSFPAGLTPSPSSRLAGGCVKVCGGGRRGSKSAERRCGGPEGPTQLLLSGRVGRPDFSACYTRICANAGTLSPAHGRILLTCETQNNSAAPSQ